jgi:hypothetical protein
VAHPFNIPAMATTDEKNFPVHNPKAPPGQSGHPYPKMLIQRFTTAMRAAWLDRYRRIDQNTRQEYWEERVPKLGDPVPLLATQDCLDAGFGTNLDQPLIANSAEEEELIYDTLGIEPMAPPASSVSIPIPLTGHKEQAYRDEIADLEARLAAAQGKAPVAAKKARGWPKGKPRGHRKHKAPQSAVKRMTLEQMAAEPIEAED